MVRRVASRPSMHMLKADETFPLAGFEAQVRRERPCGRIGSRLEWNLPHPVAYLVSPCDSVAVLLSGRLPVDTERDGRIVPAGNLLRACPIARPRGDSVTGNPPAPVGSDVLLGVRQGVYILLIT